MKTTKAEANLIYDDKVRRVLIRKGLNTYELQPNFTLKKLASSGLEDANNK